MSDEKTDFPDVRRFIGRMFVASKNIGDTINDLEKDIPILHNAVNLEQYEIDLVMTHLQAIKDYNSQVRALAGNMMETAEILEDAKHDMRQLATIAQLPLALAESSPEFFSDVVKVIGPAILDEGVSSLPDAEFEKLAAAVEKRKQAKLEDILGVIDDAV